MADIALTVPDEQFNRVVDALCARGGYTGSLDDQPARREFARTVVRDFVQQTVLQHEWQRAMVSAPTGVTIEPVTID